MRPFVSILPLLSLFVAFGQQVVHEEIAMSNGNIQIPGTLSYPESKEPLPLVVFVSGSGNVDRDGNQHPFVKANYVAQLADSLNAHGIAVYRYDKRTAVRENLAKLANIRFHDFVADAQKAIHTFADDPRFGPIYLIGHSQGALTALLALDDRIKGYVSLAGAGVPIARTLVHQLQAQGKDLAQAATAHFEELMETDTIQDVNPNLFQIFAPPNQRFLKSWMAYDPSGEITKVKVPILIVQGDKDLQVGLSDANTLFSAARSASEKQDVPVELKIIPDMNHVLKSVSDRQANQASYLSPDYPLSATLVKTIVEFINTNG